MKLNPAAGYKMRQVMSITILWIIIGVLVELFYAVSFNPVTRQFFLYFTFGDNALQHLMITAIGPLAGGILAGSFIVFYQREKLKGKTYGRKILIHSFLYSIFVSVCILIVGTLGAIFDKSDADFWQKFDTAVFNLRVFRLLITWYFIVIGTIFLLDVSEKYGRGTLKKLLLGKYHVPRQEDRIFMFLDLKSSTTIAEKIGDVEYFLMLKHFFRLATEPVLSCNGEIYQYVGDEIIISWERKEGLKNANCLKCFMLIREAVEKDSGYFMDHFKTVPDFKAAIHAGVVTTGEIGIIKKEIVYSGDILNTTARIMSLCNQYAASLLISKIIYSELKDTEGYKFTYLDSPELRGKTIKMPVYSVARYL
ncbi:MAG: adenylate/guanylate cyclase domain-containing protein [Chitinophagaceae bacterium]|nr:adenylate/guanylate cyclase domain-containing protein [Chitinophagaceae bacterium]